MGGPTPSRHQAWELFRLMTPGNLPPSLPHPQLTVPDASTEWAKQQFATMATPRLALLPGAQRGPSKQWPEHHVQQLLQEWLAQTDGTAVLLGTSDDMALCTRLRSHAGPQRVLDLSNQTNLHQLAAVLAEVDAVLANDSGGMHLAAALGTPTVGIFGLTDPERTGPIGPKVRILQKSDQRSRDIPRDCPQARQALEKVTPREAFGALLELLAQPPPSALQPSGTPS